MQQYFKENGKENSSGSRAAAAHHNGDGVHEYFQAHRAYEDVREGSGGVFHGLHACGRAREWAREREYRV